MVESQLFTSREGEPNPRHSAHTNFLVSNPTTYHGIARNMETVAKRDETLKCSKTPGTLTPVCYNIGTKAHLPQPPCDDT